MNEKYDFKTVEEKWRAYWNKIDLYRTGNDPDKPARNPMRAPPDSIPTELSS